MSDHYTTVRISDTKPLLRYIREGDWVTWERPIWNRRHTKRKGVHPEYVRIHRLSQDMQWSDIQILTARGVYTVCAAELRTIDINEAEREQEATIEPDWLPERCYGCGWPVTDEHPAGSCLDKAYEEVTL